MHKELRIIFYGTPDFAVASLDAILKAGFNVVAVVTAPDRQAGRGMKLRPSAVKQFALQKQLPVLQPSRLKSEGFQEQLRIFKPTIQVVIAFRMMPEKVWNFPELGTINLHASLLPQYRGAAPINHAIINGEKKTGVSTFRLKHEIDTGNILKQKEVEITDSDNAGTLHDKLMYVGAELMVDTLREIEKGTEQEQEQIYSEQLYKAPKIFKDDCLIDWNQSSRKIRDLIRGLSPYPVARTKLAEKTLKVFQAELVPYSGSTKPGSFETDQKTYLRVHAADGKLELTDVQLEGKKRMSVQDFLRGFTVPVS